MAEYTECRSPRSSGASAPVKATFSDGFAVATDGCRLSYHLSGDPAATDKVVDPPQTYELHLRPCLAPQFVHVFR